MKANLLIDRQFEQLPYANIDSRPPIAHRVVCAIDMGSKNFKMVTGQEINGLTVINLVKKKTLQLGKELAENNNIIGWKKLLEVEQVLQEFKQDAEAAGISSVLAIATKAIREAENRGEIVARARAIGIDVQIADGRREAEVGYLAATQGSPGDLVVEMGSQSFQVAWDTAGKIDCLLDDSGYEHAFENFIKNAAGFNQARVQYRAFLAERLQGLPRTTNRLFALAANTVASFVTGKPKNEITDNYLPKAALDDTIRALGRMTPSEFLDLVAIKEKINKILPGLVLLHFIAEKTGHDKVFVANAELPVGLIVEHFQEMRNESFAAA